MRSTLLLAFFSATLLLQAQASRADTATICEAAEADDYLSKTSGQFLRGATNLGFCWLEMIHQPALEARSERRNLFLGLLNGIGRTGLRAVKGLGDLATCVAPHRDKDGNFPRVARDCAFGAVGLEER